MTSVVTDIEGLEPLGSLCVQLFPEDIWVIHACAPVRIIVVLVCIHLGMSELREQKEGCSAQKGAEGNLHFSHF